MSKLFDDKELSFYNKCYSAAEIEKLIIEFVDCLDEVSNNVLKFPKISVHEKKTELRICPGTNASVQTLKGINQLCLCGDIVDAFMLIRKLRDNLYLDLFLFYKSDWNLIIDEKGTIKIFDDSIRDVVCEWKSGKLIDPENSRKKFFGFKSYIGQIEENPIIKTCHKNYLENDFKLLDRILNDFAHSNSPSHLHNPSNPYSESEWKLMIDDFKLLKKCLEILMKIYIVDLFFIDGTLLRDTEYCDEISCGLIPEEGCDRRIIFPAYNVLKKIIKDKNFELYNYIASNNKYDLDIFIHFFSVEEKKIGVEVVAALIEDNGKFMICQRSSNKAKHLLWEFVGGIVETNETKEAALIRVCKERLAITPSIEEKFTNVTYEYSNISIHITVYHVKILDGISQKSNHKDIRWITISETKNYEFCPVDVSIVKELVKMQGCIK